jgi:probable H4MPT-linked C1 transfer pathway protein
MISMHAVPLAEPPGPPIIGWDIGGVNLKAARLEGGTLTTVVEPFELQRAPHRLAAALASLAARLGSGPHDLHAVTMTAELSQYFRTKREGVTFVLDALSAALGEAAVQVWCTDGRFRPPADLAGDPVAAAASNWLAAAVFVAAHAPNTILVDVGSTTTDVIPIARGAVAAIGRTDPDRLRSGELIYTGALRTPIEAVVKQVPFKGDQAAVSAEGFAITADLHLWLGNLPAEEYTVPTPDGRPATRTFAGERLARVVCGDREMVAEADIDRLATAVADAQLADIADAIRRVRARHPELYGAVVTGVGDFVAAAAARLAGLAPAPLADVIGKDGARAAPAAAVAYLLRALRTAPV